MILFFWVSLPIFLIFWMNFPNLSQLSLSSPTFLVWAEKGPGTGFLGSHFFPTMGGGDEDDDEEEEEEGEHSCDIWVLNLGGIAAGRPGGSALAVD